MASVQTDPAYELSSSPRGPTSCSKRKTNRTVAASTEKLSKSMRNYVRSRVSPARAHLHKRLLRAQASIDPEVDRDIVAVAVDFMLGATYKGCVRLVLKFAEHLKYTFSLEDKVNQLNKELKEMKKLKSPPSSSVSISLESETSRLLSKPCVVSSVKPKAKRMELENNTDFLLPGVVPNVTKINHDQTLSKSPPLVSVFGLQDKAFSTSDVTGALPQISPIIKESPCDKKNSADTETQTAFCASSRKRIMVERACSPIHSQTDPENSIVQEQLKTAQEMVQKLLNQQLAIVQKEKNCRDTETQTECESSRKPELVERGCSPYLAQEKVTQLQQLLTPSEDENKICFSASSRKPECKPIESLGPELMCLNRKGSITTSVTNDSSKSFPGVKNKRDKCCCTTCVQAMRKARVQKPKRRLRSGKEEWPRIGSCVFVKGRGKGTVKYLGKLEGAGTKMQVGVNLDKPVGENNGTWCETRYFDCPSNCGVFVPVEHVQQIVTKNDTR